MIGVRGLKGLVSVRRRLHAPSLSAANCLPQSAPRWTSSSPPIPPSSAAPGRDSGDSVMSTDPLSLREQIQRMANASSGTPDDLASFLSRLYLSRGALSDAEVTKVRDHVLLLLDTRSGDSILERMTLSSLYKMAFFVRETTCALVDALERDHHHHHHHHHHPFFASAAAAAASSTSTSTSSASSSSSSSTAIPHSNASNIPLQALQLAASNIGHNLAALMRIRANSLRSPEEIFAWFEGAALLLGLHDRYSSTWKALLGPKRRKQLGQKKDADFNKSLSALLESDAPPPPDSDTIDELQPAVSKLVSMLQACYQSQSAPFAAASTLSAPVSCHHDYPPLLSPAEDYGSSSSSSSSVSRGFSQLHAYLAVFQAVSLSHPQAPREVANRLFCIVNHPLLTARCSSSDEILSGVTARERLLRLVELLQHVRAITHSSDAVANAAADATRLALTAFDRAILRCIKQNDDHDDTAVPTTSLFQREREDVLLALELVSLHTELRPSGFICPALFVPLLDRVASIAELQQQLQQQRQHHVGSSSDGVSAKAISPQELLELCFRLFKLRSVEPRLLASLINTVWALLKDKADKGRVSGASGGAGDSTSELSTMTGKLLRMLHGLGVSNDLLRSMGTLKDRTGQPDAESAVSLGADRLASFLADLAQWQESEFASEMPRIYRRTPFSYPHHPAVWQERGKKEASGPVGPASNDAEKPVPLFQRYRTPQNKKAKEFSNPSSSRGTTLFIGDVRVLPPTFYMQDSLTLIQALCSLSTALQLKNSNKMMTTTAVPVPELTQRSRELFFAELSRLWQLPYRDITEAFRSHPSGARLVALVNQLQSLHFWSTANLSSSSPAADAVGVAALDLSAREKEAALRRPDEWEVTGNKQLFPDWALKLCRFVWREHAAKPFPQIGRGSGGAFDLLVTPDIEPSTFQSEVFAAVRELCAAGGALLPSASSAFRATTSSPLPLPVSEYVIPELSCAVDMAWPKERIVVEVDGPTHYQARPLSETAALLAKLSGRRDRADQLEAAKQKAERAERRAKKRRSRGLDDDTANNSNSGSGSSSSSGSDSESEGDGKARSKPSSGGANGVRADSRAGKEQEEDEEAVVVMVNERGGILGRTQELLPSALLREAALRACGYTVLRISCHDLYILSAFDAVQAGVPLDAAAAAAADAASIEESDGRKGGSGADLFPLPRAPASRPSFFWTRSNPRAVLHKLLADAGVWDKLKRAGGKSE